MVYGWGDSRRLTDQAEAVDDDEDETNVSDRLAKVLAVELFKVMEQLLERCGGDKEAPKRASANTSPDSVVGANGVFTP